MRESITGLLTVFRKEVLDNMRDRRSLLLGLVYPLLGPVLLGIMVSLAAGLIRADSQKPVQVAIENAEAAPGLVAFLRAAGVERQALDGDAETAVRRGHLDSVVVVPADYAAAFAAGRPIAVRVLIHPARLDSVAGANRVFALLDEYNRTLGRERLAARGIDIALASPLQLQAVNVAGDTGIVDIFMFMVPPFFIFTVFMGGVYLALDTISGERERGSLEPLLVNPVPRWALMGGKFLAGVLFTAVGLVVQLVAFKVAFVLAGDAGATLARSLDPGAMLAVLAVAIPLMGLAVAVQIIVAIGTRSFKEAQTYLGLLPLVPAIPGMVLVFSPVEAQGWVVALPAFGQTLLFGQIVRGEAVAPGDALLAAAATLLVTALLLFFAARLHERESLIFGR